MQKQEEDRRKPEGHESLAGVTFSNLSSSLKIFLVCFVLVYLTASYLVRSLCIQEGSIYPTLKIDESGFGNVFPGRFQETKRGDVVVVYDEKKTHTYWVKHVVGLPGERVRTSRDTVYINDAAIQEPYFDDNYADSIRLTGNYKLAKDFDKVQPRKDEYYLVGGDRYTNEDSRETGAFRHEDTEAVDFFIVLPFNEMRVAE